MSIGSKLIFFWRRYTNGEQAHEKILNIICHQRNKTTVRQHFIPTRIAIIKKSDNITHRCTEPGTLKAWNDGLFYKCC